MIKVKTFVMNSGNPLHHDRLENMINKFLAENEVEVIDICTQQQYLMAIIGCHRQC